MFYICVAPFVHHDRRRRGWAMACLLVGAVVLAAPPCIRADASDYKRGQTLTLVGEGARVDCSHDGEWIYFCSARQLMRI